MSTILNDIVERESGVTMLNNIVGNIRQWGVKHRSVLFLSTWQHVAHFLLRTEEQA